MQTCETWGFPKKINSLFFQFWIKKILASIVEYFDQHKLFFYLLISKKRKNYNFDQLSNFKIGFVYFFPGEVDASTCFSKYFGKKCPNESVHIVFSSPQQANIFSYQNKEYVSLYKDISVNDFCCKKTLCLQYITILIPLFDDYKKFLLFNLLFRFLFAKILNCKIYYPMEGHSWEKSLNSVSSKCKNLKTYGFLHALNITCPTNLNLKYSLTFSPNFAIAQCKEAKGVLLNYGWQKKQIFIKTIDRNSPIDNVRTERSTGDIKSILLIGSFKRVEDIAALDFLIENYSSDDYKIYYKAHPLIIPFISKHSKKLSMPQNIKISNVIEGSYDMIFSPLSSTTSIQLLKSSVENIFYFFNPNYHCPNPLAQFNIKLINVSSSENYTIYTNDNNSFSMPSIFLDQNKIQLFS